MNEKEYIPPLPRNHSVRCELCGRRIIPSEGEILGGKVKGKREATFFHRRCWQREQTQLAEEAMKGQDSRETVKQVDAFLKEQKKREEGTRCK